MKLFGFEITRAVEEKAQTFTGDVLQRLRAAQMGQTGFVTPENCMESPTVHAIVTAISRRISVSPVQVIKKTGSGDKATKEVLPNHPVAKLLQYPNSWQSRSEYWLDAASTFVRYGRFIAFKSQGTTGPIRELLPINPKEVNIKQDPDTWRIQFERNGELLNPKKIHYARGPARNFVKGDSTIDDVSTAIALEILAERFGAAFFQNGAVPFLVFQFLQGSGGFKTPEDSKQFIDDFQEAFGGNKAHKALLLPKGMDKPFAVPIDNDKAQFLDTRKYQRTVIAGAFGVPPHLVGDLDRATFNNVEQQDSDFTLNVVMPIAQAFEAAMERDLLTDQDVRDGIVIRFNLDSVLRADFKSRQEGLQIQRQNGVISANEWREKEGMNPIDDTNGGDDYIYPANFAIAGEPVPAPGAPADQGTQGP